MTDDDRIDVALRLLFETFSVTPTPAQIAGYRMGLEGIAPDAIERATRLALRESDRMPTPAKIRELARRQAVPTLGPSLTAIRAERDRVKRSWQGGPPVPTLGEMVQSCRANADLAERQAIHCRDRIGRLPPGDTAINQLRVELERHLADYRHWSEYVGHYRERAAKEGDATVPRVTLP